MVIKELAEYYDLLYSQGKIISPDFEEVPVSHLIVLTPDGRIESIVNWRVKEVVTDKKGNKNERWLPRKVIMPKRFSKAGATNIVEHRPDYLFGLQITKEGTLTTESKLDNLRKHHETCVKENMRFLEDIQTPVATAYKNFLINWQPEKETENAELLRIADELGKASFAFALSGEYPDPLFLLHEDDAVKRKWETVSDTFFPNSSGKGQCCISGEIVDIALTHDRLKNVPGAQSRSSLVSYNNVSELSYGMVQSQNSAVGMSVMKIYVAALNYLLNGNGHKVVYDDLTILFWSADRNEAEEQILKMFLSDYDKDDGWEEVLREAFMKARKWKLSREHVDGLIDGSRDRNFYILGVKPNGGRVAVVFFYHGLFPEILARIADFEDDIQTGDSPYMLTLNHVRFALFSKAKKVNKGLMEEIQRSVFEGIKYPADMAASVLSLINRDGNLSRPRMGLLKAYLRRNYKEVLGVGLDRANSNKMYLCGRLFAVARKVQEDGARRDINRTLFDRYFKQVRISPEATIPKVRDSYEYYLKKVKNPGRYGKEMTEIIMLMDGSYPSGHQDSKNQIMFLMGFDDQYNNFFIKNSDKTVGQTKETKDQNEEKAKEAV